MPDALDSILLDIQHSHVETRAIHLSSSLVYLLSLVLQLRPFMFGFVHIFLAALVVLHGHDFELHVVLRALISNSAQLLYSIVLLLALFLGRFVL